MKRWRRRRPGQAVLVSLTATGLLAGAAATASAQPDPPPYILPPAPGVTPTTAWGAGVSDPGILYTAADGTVWSRGADESLAYPDQGNGHLIGAPVPLPIDTDSSWLFGRGTDKHLWYQKSIPEYTSPWYPLGGGITARPAVASLGGNAWEVFARGTDGALWDRVYNGSKWADWARIGGQILAGTGPTVAGLTGTGQLYVGVVGTNHQIYLKEASGSGGFFSIGGQTTADPALTAVSSTALAVFCRGTDNVGYYTRYTAAGAAGWRSMGGKLTSGVSAATGTVNGKTSTYTIGLGTNAAIYGDTGTWTSYPPSFGGWK